MSWNQPGRVGDYNATPVHPGTPAADFAADQWGIPLEYRHLTGVVCEGFHGGYTWDDWYSNIRNRRACPRCKAAV